MNIFATIVISAIVTIASAFGVYNYLPVSFMESKTPSKLGATITTINGSDTLSSSRAVINTNFANLNSDKIEATQTTLNSLTSATSLASLPALTTVGTIISGTWHGSTVTVPWGGTGSTTLAANQILIGNGVGAVGVVSGLGTNGQFLISAGAGTAPIWTSDAVVNNLTATNATSTGKFNIPNGASPSVVTTGDIAIDTTSDQLIGYGTSAKKVYGNGNLYGSFTYATSTTATGTSTIPLGVARVGEIWNDASCYTDTGTWQVSFTDGTNRMDFMNASTTANVNVLSTNTTFTAGEKRYVEIGTPTTSPTKISCTISRSITAD
jgi:hypothetical protein